jgi:alkylation response protein AidB-like acyl-CoA dehydrogenase
LFVVDRQPRPISGIRAGEGACPGKLARSAKRRRKITQIYEGTNQIQRMVMARALLR